MGLPGYSFSRICTRKTWSDKYMTPFWQYDVSSTSRWSTLRRPRTKGLGCQSALA